jgi:hypothetical protein
VYALDEESEWPLYVKIVGESEYRWPVFDNDIRKMYSTCPTTTTLKTLSKIEELASQAFKIWACQALLEARAAASVV